MRVKKILTRAWRDTLARQRTGKPDPRDPRAGPTGARLGLIVDAAASADA